MATPARSAPGAARALSVYEISTRLTLKERGRIKGFSVDLQHWMI